MLLSSGSTLPVKCRTYAAAPPIVAMAGQILAITVESFTQRLLGSVVRYNDRGNRRSQRGREGRGRRPGVRAAGRPQLRGRRPGRARERGRLGARAERARGGDRGTAAGAACGVVRATRAPAQ